MTDPKPPTPDPAKPDDGRDELDLNALERLLAEATPGPWTLEDWRQDGGHDRNVVTGWRGPEHAVERELFRMHAARPDGRIVPVKIVDLRESDGRPEDAAFILAICNAAPALIAIARRALTARAPAAAQGAGLAVLTERVSRWVRHTFTDGAMSDLWERAARVVEEAVELGQAQGLSEVEAFRIMRRVYDRPSGDPKQEAGGLMVTLLAWAGATATDLDAVTLAEIERIEQPATIERIRAKQAEKAVAGTGRNYAAAAPAQAPAVMPGEGFTREELRDLTDTWQRAEYTAGDAIGLRRMDPVAASDSPAFSREEEKDDGRRDVRDVGDPVSNLAGMDGVLCAPVAGVGWHAGCGGLAREAVPARDERAGHPAQDARCGPVAAGSAAAVAPGAAPQHGAAPDVVLNVADHAYEEDPGKPGRCAVELFAPRKLCGWPREAHAATRLADSAPAMVVCDSWYHEAGPHRTSIGCLNPRPAPAPAVGPFTRQELHDLTTLRPAAPAPEKQLSGEEAKHICGACGCDRLENSRLRAALSAKAAALDEAEDRAAWRSEETHEQERRAEKAETALAAALARVEVLEKAVNVAIDGESHPDYCSYFGTYGTPTSEDRCDCWISILRAALKGES